MLAVVIWYSSRLLPVAILVALVMTTVVLWLYPSQVRFLSRPWRWVLPGLRVLAVLALSASILKPVALRPRSDEEQPAVIVAVDRSRSMDVPNGTGSPAWLVEAADALGLLPPGTRSEAMKDLEGELLRFVGLERDPFVAAASSLAARAPALPQTGGLPEALKELATPLNDAAPWREQAMQRTARAREAVEQVQRAEDLQLYQSNPQVQQICNDLATRSRLGLAEDVLVNPRTGLLARFNGSQPLFGFAVAEEATPLPLRGQGQPVRLLMLKADGNKSDLGGSLLSALDKFRRQPVEAIVLLSDGRSVGEDPASVAALAAAEVPVFAVSAAAAQVPPSDISVSRLTMPDSQFVNETLVVRAELRSSGYNGRTVEVVLECAGQRLTQPATLADNAPATVEFSFKHESPGVLPMTVSVAAQDGEVATDNNRAQRWVKVLAERLRIAAYAGAPSWDFQYLRNALSRTPWAVLEEAILGGEAVKLVLAPQDIYKQDVVILSDVAAASLTPEQRDAITKSVSDRGKSLVLVAGDAHLPTEYVRAPELAAWLPYTVDRPAAWLSWGGEEPAFHIAPTAEARDLDALRLSDDPAKPAASRWAELSAFFRILDLPDLKPNARALLVERETGTPVLTEMRLGLGRVYFFGATETWRWRRKIGEQTQDRFWLQLLRYAAEEPYAVTQQGLSLDVDKVAVEPLEPVRVRARAVDADGMPSKAPSQTVKVFQDGNEIQALTMSRLGPDGNGRYEATIEDLPQGEYEIVLTGTPAGQEPRLPLHVAASAEAEMTDLSADPAALRQLALSTGGELLGLDELRHLPAQLDVRRQRQPQLTETSLWDSYYLFSFVVACLGLEWALRKRLGLA